MDLLPCFGIAAFAALTVISWVVCAGMIWLVVTVGRWNQGLVETPLEKFAHENELHFSPGSPLWPYLGLPFVGMPSISGNYRGRKLEMGYQWSTKEIPSWKSFAKAFYCRMSVRSDIAMEISYHGLIKRKAAPEIKLGVPEFDRIYVVRAKDEKRARRILSPPIRRKIEPLMSLSPLPTLRLGNGEISYDTMPTSQIVPASHELKMRLFLEFEPEELQLIAETLDAVAKEIEKK